MSAPAKLKPATRTEPKAVPRPASGFAPREGGIERSRVPLPPPFPRLPPPPSLTRSSVVPRETPALRPPLSQPPPAPRLTTSAPVRHAPPAPRLTTSAPPSEAPALQPRAVSAFSPEPIPLAPGPVADRPADGAVAKGVPTISPELLGALRSIAPKTRHPKLPYVFVLALLTVVAAIGRSAPMREFLASELRARASGAPAVSRLLERFVKAPEVAPAVVPSAVVPAAAPPSSPEGSSAVHATVLEALPSAEEPPPAARVKATGGRPAPRRAARARR